MSVGSQLPNGAVEFTCERVTGQKEALCTFLYCTITSGFNLAELQNQPFPPVFTSTFNNGQNNLMRVPLGTVVNTGATITAGTTLVDSDVVYFKVGLQLADSENAIQGMSVSVKAALIFDTVNYTAIGQMSIKREGAEEAKITVHRTVHEVGQSIWTDLSG
ncbi:hypothetical protein FGIG_08592 [Fasciola gigantica]|uniref:Uncharacterized protein n=1 Tax=Fasciola gigantica TaxID=46835 RepID=A0A504YB40_FASGI|nr:hypothetical protein FGIG_08592 [Fasciola gigantica]